MSKITTSSPKKEIYKELIKNLLSDATEEQLAYLYTFISLKLDTKNKN